MWNCTHFRHPTDEQLRHVDISFLATKKICSLSTLNFYIQLFRERLSVKMCTRQSRHVIWDMINTLFLTTAVEPIFLLPLALAKICPWPLVPFFQFSLENRADKTTHNTFRDCREHFFRQPFSKQLYLLVVRSWHHPVYGNVVQWSGS